MAHPTWVPVMLPHPGAIGTLASGLTRPWEWAGGPAREAEDRASPSYPLARGQVLAWLTPQGVWTGETAVLATPGLFHREGNRLTQVHSKCSVSGKNLPLVGL